MPSQLHEILLLLFRNRPELAPELLRHALHVELPAHAETRVESPDLSQALPAQYHADHVVLLVDRDRQPVLGIIVEVQLRTHERKRFVWPLYVAGLRARLECPVCLLVLTVSETVARWAAQPVDLGDGNRFRPRVLALAEVPEILDEAQARADPELAVLSVMAHGRSADTDKALRIARLARAASANLDPQRAVMYGDLVFLHCSEDLRKELQNMDPAKYEVQSEYLKHYIALGRMKGIEQGREEGKAEGKAEGRAEGRAALVLRLLSLRFGPLTSEVQTLIAAATIEQLDAVGERLLSAQTLQEALSAITGREP